MGMRVRGSFSFLMKRTKLESHQRFRYFKSWKKSGGYRCEVKVNEYSASNIIMHRARSRELPNLPQDGKKIIGYRKAIDS